MKSFLRPWVGLSWLGLSLVFGCGRSSLIDEPFSDTPWDASADGCPNGAGCDKGDAGPDGCQSDADCDKGQQCNTDTGTCEDRVVLSCNGDGDCTDPNNPRCDTERHVCGECLPGGNDCGPKQTCTRQGDRYTCSSGCKGDEQCRSEAEPFARCCNDACIDTSSDTENCGACGSFCPTNNVALPTCSQGVCGGTCSAGFLDCDFDTSNGCEQDILGDANHCGSCDVICSAQGIEIATCNFGRCSGNCLLGNADCDGDKQQNGCEVALSTDPDNCGACGQLCSNNHILSPSCTFGTCSGTCDPGYLDCDASKLTDGCEVSILTDPDNCGDCNVVCSDDHVSKACSAGECAGACDNGYADCDDDKLSNGCEVYTQTDKNNCGGCNTVCSNNHIPSPSCSGGTCNGACAGGYADCDSNKQTNGCEIYTQTDKNNCGGCNVACSNNHIPSPSCDTGVCKGTCAAGYNDCDGNKQSNGCETFGSCSLDDIAIVAADYPNYSADVKAVLVATGAFTKVDVLDAQNATPTLATLMTYDAVLVYSDYQFNSATMLGDNLADYFDAGGRVVIATFAHSSGWDLKGRFITDGYNLLAPGTYTTMSESAPVQIVDPDSALVIGVSTLTSTSGYKSVTSAINGASVVAKWGTSGAPLIATGLIKNRPRADINLFPPSVGARADFWAGDGGKIMKNALLYGRPTSYMVNAGVIWTSNPPTYTCREACALQFGGVASHYFCSTIGTSINQQASESCWGVSNCQIETDDFKINTLYNCGSFNCACSAYVNDNCFNGTNYCFRL